MSGILGSFGALTEQIRTPLSVSALAFLILYAIYRQLFKLNIFAPVGRKGTLTVVNTVLGRLFWLALIALILGVGGYAFSLYIARATGDLKSAPHLLDARPDPALAADLYDVLDGRLVDSGTNRKSKFGYTVRTRRPTYPEALAAIDFKFENKGRSAAFV